MDNPYVPVPMRVKMARFESDDRSLKTIDLEPVEGEIFDFMPGQFCEISILGKGEAPFGIASVPWEGILRFTINRAGLVTTAIHQLEEGDVVGVRGPLGNWYPVDLFEGKNIVIVSGGFAFTTLRSLIKYLLKNRERFGKITLVYGARRPDLLLYRDEIEEWEKSGEMDMYITIDKPVEGWEGYVGFVPQVLEQASPSPENAYLVMCGPPAMIKFTLPVIEKLGFKPETVFTSLERRMKCGIGKCGRCNIGKYYVCKDGPVFSLDQLNKLPKEY